MHSSFTPRMLSAFAVLTVANFAHAQIIGGKPVRIVTAEVGGGNDFVARLVAHGVTGLTGQPAVVENHGGASGALASQIVAKAAPDGATLLLYSGSLWILPLLKGTTPFDPNKDFTAITLAASSPNVLVVHPSLPVKSVKDLIVVAKAKPGVLNYASGSTGASTHLAPELFKSMTGTNIVRIAYQGNGGAYSDLVSGQVDLMFATTGGAAAYIRSNRLRGIAVTSLQPSALMPGMPTVAGTVPGYESTSMYGVFAPPAAPAALISRLNQELIRVLNDKDVKEKLLASGVEAIGSTPDQLIAKIKTEMMRLGKVIKDANIHAD